MRQTDLFLVQPAPHLDVARFEAWPFPGLTALETAQSSLALSSEFRAVIVSTIHSLEHAMVTEQQVLAAIPLDWKTALGPWAHAGLSDREAEAYGIKVKYVPHDGGGFHFQYQQAEADRGRVKKAGGA